MKAHVAAFFRTTPLSCMFYNTSGGRHTRFKCDWSSDVCSSDLVSSAQTKTHTRPAEETPAAGDVSARYSIVFAAGCDHDSPGFSWRQRAINLMFAGTPFFAAVSLESLIAEGYAIELVLTQPDRPAGRGLR